MYISGGNDKLSCKLFPGTLRGVAMHWMTTLPARSIRTFNDLVGLFLSQFATNKTKRLEVANIFDIKQSRGESLKSYLARFNNATVQVDDPDLKFFGLKVGPFNDALALQRLASMEEIRARAEKHEAERIQVQEGSKHLARGRPQAPKRQVHGEHHAVLQHFTPLKEKKAQILREICHTKLLEFPQEVKGQVMGKSRGEWCDFHRASEHSTEECWTLGAQLESLVQRGHLGRYVYWVNQQTSGSRGDDRGYKAERPCRKHRERTQSPQPASTQFRGTIATILGGGSTIPPQSYGEGREKHRTREV
ncbi:hypothetical protein CR513_32005, partial [Mucuna pruriens]